MSVLEGIVPTFALPSQWGTCADDGEVIKIALLGAPGSVLQGLVPDLPKKEEKQAVPMRQFGDATTTRKAIYDAVLASARSIKPVANQRYSLELGDVDYEGPEDYSVRDQKKAILEGRSLHRRLRGNWMLKDPTGKVVEQKRLTLAQVPYMTPRGTFILNGNEYTLAHQMRLRPGIFTRLKENGEVESHVNVLPGKGLSHHYLLEPETGVFKLGLRQAQMPLLPLMRAVGVTDQELKKAWGAELFAANQKKDDRQVINKLYDRLIRKKNPRASYEEKVRDVAHVITSMELDEEVTKRTLGQGYRSLNKEALLAATSKLLKVSRGEAETDDRDHLAYQNLLGPEDLIAERVKRSNQMLNQALWKASYKGNLSNLQPGAMTKMVQGAIMDSGLGQPLEEINPADVLDQQTRVSRLGYGGIPSMDAVPDEARNVQPSHVNFVDLVRTPESFKIGVDSRISFAARKGADGKLYSQFVDPRSGTASWMTPQEVSDKVIAFPGEMNRKGSRLVAAQVNGRTRLVPRHKVDLEMPHFEHAFSPLANVVPLKSMAKGQRVAMGSRFLTQALPLSNAEAPLVQGAMPGQEGSFEKYYGKQMGAVFAEKMHGRVDKVTDDEIHVKYEDGSRKKYELYRTFPYNRKTYLHNEPLVQPGDPIVPGQALAKSNYTDKSGTMALGLNVRVAYIPFRGSNYEDAYVISESAAQRFSSEHMYQQQTEWDDKVKRGKKSYVSIFPSKYTRAKLDLMDDDGVIKEGTEVSQGDPLVLIAKQRELSHKQVHSAHKGSFADNSLTWDHHSPGIVTDVAKTSKGVTVAVKSIAPTKEGDKISGRYGDKGIIAAIVPDDEMPRGTDGQPFEVLSNSLGVISRTNPSQIVEGALGKIATKNGKPFVVKDFDDIEDMTEWAMQQLEENGLEDTETIEDPETGKQIKDVYTGNRFFMKLHHTSESKGSGRGLGGYTAEDQPSRGGAGGAKRLALMDVNALLSHGATDVLRDAKLIRGQKNQEYWSSFMSGYRPATPRVPLVYEKFVNQLRAAGINVTRSGEQTQLLGMTDKDVEQMAGDRELKNVETVNWQDAMKPKKGGLFDVSLTGGHGGNRWSYIKLIEPMPNPVMEEPMRRLLGLTQKKFEAVLGGQEKLDGRTGPQAIQAALKRINVDRMLEQCREDVKSGKKTARDTAIRRLGYLRTCQKTGLHPSEWMINKLPVLPPIFRPVSTMQGSGTQLVADANFLYKEVFDANRNLEEIRGEVDDVAEERQTLYKAMKAVTGLGDPVQPKNKEKRIRGMLQQVFGWSPKLGTVQQKLLGSPVDLVGRAVVAPNPDLNLDQVGLPENQAWEVYYPFVIRRLVRRGVPRLTAMQYARDRNDTAKKALIDEMDDRPLLVNRAPVLHRYGLMAFKPRLIKGDVLQVNPTIVGGFNMDFDGDASNFHVPASDDAKEEALEKMLPSKNLLSVSQFKVHYTPRQEYVGGLYDATAKVDKKKKAVTFGSVQDAIRAYEAGRVDADQRVIIMDS